MSEIRRIQSLESSVVDQIAAGEVVERPAHLLKELLENSLDAGATEIEIDLGEGGREVTVIDNGSGLHPDDLAAALSRHATSKIQASDDLWKLSTYGFRGEALASIAAVSNLTLSSRIETENLGREIRSEFGQVMKQVEVAHQRGTRVQIQNLFGNVPARLKFLKSAAAEISQMKNVVKAIALSHPQTGFRLRVDGNLQFLWTRSAGYQERAQAVLGTKVLFEGRAEREGVKAYALFTDPEQVQKTAKNIWIFAQNRWVQDRGLQAAVMEAYRNLLMHGEYPMAAVFVECETDQIDVNIHPTKSAVKFAQPAFAFRAVQASIRDLLQTAPWLKRESTATASFAPARTQSLLGDSMLAPQQSSWLEQSPERVQYQQKEISWMDESLAIPQASSTPVSFKRPIEKLSPDTTGHWSKLQVLAQANLTYLICQNNQGLVLIDQHAAHERVLFERLKQSWSKGATDVQDYLFPLALDMSADRVEAILVERAQFAKMGLNLEQLGPSTIGILSAPNVLKESALLSALEKAGEELVDLGGSGRLEQISADFFARLACHSAVRAGQAMSVSEMQSLLEQMDEFPLSSFCPHGRPVSVPYQWNEVEKDFGRLV